MTGNGERHPAGADASLWRTVRAVAWAMLGIRNGDEFRKDQHALRPLQVLAVGLVGLFLLVLLLIGVVRWVV